MDDYCVLASSMALMILFWNGLNFVSPNVANVSANVAISVAS